MHQICQLLDQLSSLDAKRFFLIANNADLKADAVQRLLEDGDVVVQYNACMFDKAFGKQTLNTLVFHTINDAELLPNGYSFWGRPPIRNKDYKETITAFLTPTKLSKQTEGQRARLPRLPKDRSILDMGRLEDVGPPIAKRYIYSAGMSSLVVLAAHNVERALRGVSPAQIVLCGFTGQYGGAGWVGHDFDAEQAAIGSMPNLHKLSETGIEPWTPVEAPQQAELAMLARVFSGDTDFTAHDKNTLVFDIARLFFHAGDIREFLRINKNLLVASNNNTQQRLRWMAETRDLVNDDREVMEPLERKHDFYTNLAGKIAFRGFFGEREQPELKVLGPQAAYRMSGSEKPRILIINDTASMFYNRFHMGCAIVCMRLREELEARGFEVAGWANGTQGLHQIIAEDPGLTFDSVLVNGEGTLHHDAYRAFEIGTMVQFLKASGKKVFLINTVWEENSGHLEQLFRDVDLFAVRESRSLENLRKFRPDARVVPDICWSLEPLKPEGPGDGLGFQDSVLEAETALLRRHADACETPLYVMHHYYEGLRREFIAETPAHLLPKVLDKAGLFAHDSWVTGRFHGLILALLHGLPVVALASNTPKIEAMLGDIGLSEKLLGYEALEGMDGPLSVDTVFAGARVFGSGDWEKVARFRGRAVEETRSLFDDIGLMNRLAG